MAKKRVLVVGAGSRVKSTHLPALLSLTSELELAGIVAREHHDLTQWNAGITLFSNPGFEGIELKTVDLLILSVPPKAVASVLESLAVYNTRHITLLIDTPVIHASHLRKLWLLKRFRASYSLEDFPQLRTFAEARRIIREGSIGNLRRVTLSRSAAFHHSLAIFRALTNVASFSFMWRVKTSSDVAITASFGSVKTELLLPTDYEHGSFRIEGTDGIIASDNLAQAKFILSVRKSPGGAYGGLEINGQIQETTEEERLYRAQFPNRTLESISIHEPLWLNEMKIHSVMRLMRSALADGVLLDAPLDGVYDLLPLPFLERFGFLCDLPFGKRSSLIRTVLRTFSGGTS